MTADHTIVVDLVVDGEVYEVSGFDDRDQALDFMEEVDDPDNDSVEVEGPY